MTWRNDQVSERETRKILKIARECLRVPGDFVEMGCFRGDTSILLAEVLREHEQEKRIETGEKGGRLEVKKGDNREKDNRRKRLWLYDSFEGLPEKGEEDVSAMGEEFREGALTASKREVKARFLRSGLFVPRIVKGWFSDLLPEDLPEEIAFAFLDGDFYASTLDCLKLVRPRMAPGGVILVHDFNNPELPGVALAVEESWEREGIEIFETLAILRRK